MQKVVLNYNEILLYKHIQLDQAYVTCLMEMCKQKEYRHQVFVACGRCQGPKFSSKMLGAPDLLRGHFHLFVNI